MTLAQFMAEYAPNLIGSYAFGYASGFFFLHFQKAVDLLY